MAWTDDDLTAVEEAIRARLLTDGSSKAMVQLTTADRSERYRDTPLADLLKLRDEIKAELRITDGLPQRRVFRGRTSKGL